MMVPRASTQAATMLQALTNHNPDVIFVDELSDRDDVRAARSIGQRGVSLVATAHADSLAALLSNTELNPLVGGVHEVIVSDASLRDGYHQPQHAGGRHAFSRQKRAKTRLERREPPLFSHVVELVSTSEWRIHWDVQLSVDTLLTGGEAAVEVRALVNGHVLSMAEGHPDAAEY